ncbi:DUF4102 domain-containing protein [Nostoc sp.]|uniref:DUF4102 domain-containing protein n=1 Tax=Nostoc sp. TaxID=1180 RepID=UPI002FFD2B2F
MNQLTLFDLQPFTKTEDTPAYTCDSFWDNLDARQDSHSVGGQISESESPCESVGEQVASNTLNTSISSNTKVSFDTQKSAPQHDTHWIEEYWVERSSNKYWYYRYCWMQGRKIHRCYLGSVNSKLARHKKADVEVWISDGQSPSEIQKLIRSWRSHS